MKSINRNLILLTIGTFAISSLGLVGCGANTSASTEGVDPGKDKVVDRPANDPQKGRMPGAHVSSKQDPDKGSQ